MTHSIKEALEALKKGDFILVCDDADREDEGDLVIAAQAMTPEKLNFMVKHTSGVVVVPMTQERLDALKIPMMVDSNTGRFRTAFTVSVDYIHGTTTGVSASDRSKTIRGLVDPLSTPEDFSRPGHIFPLKYTPGGVLKRAGHTEASLDLLMMAGMKPVAAICEVMNGKGEKASRQELIALSQQYNIPFISVADLVKYRLSQESLVELIETAALPTKFGMFTIHAFRNTLDNTEHVALVKGTLSSEDEVLVRVHSECLTGDLLSSLRCDCGDQLHMALERIEEAGQGVLVYLRGHEGRGIGLGHKIRAYHLQDLGMDTVEANLALGFPPDSRDYGIGAQILRALGITKIKLMTNNPRKYGGLDGFGLTITERIPLASPVTKENVSYLKTKKSKLGHLLETLN